LTTVGNPNLKYLLVLNHIKRDKFVLSIEIDKTCLNSINKNTSAYGKVNNIKSALWMNRCFFIYIV